MAPSPEQRRTKEVSTAVVDPGHVASDETMPFLAQALDPVQVQRCLEECCPSWLKQLGKTEVRNIRVIRHKSGRRCLIEYELEARDGPSKSISILGKVRAKGLDRKTFRVQQLLWNGSFGSASEDGIQVPEPIGVVPPLNMWLQAKAPGVPATEMLAKPNVKQVAKQIAEGIHKLHFTDIPTPRTHSMADELRILHERLHLVARTRPAWARRLEKLAQDCDRLGGSVPAPRVTGIHRDFYPAQVLVDGTHLYFLDFDLFCRGDPALDVGNFLGHVIEQSL